jgi:CubicO group peptidase (beta-lactamase class C family)
MVIGVINPRGRQTFGYGQLSATDPRAPDGKTVFEIGSATKTFTSILLAQELEQGHMRLDDPVAKYLPADVKLPVWEGRRPITLLDLVTHSAGFPHNPDDVRFNGVNNPYAGYTRQRLFAYLSRFHLPYEPGTQARYSNVGVALLAEAICMHEGSDYETLVTERICRPLGLNDTRVTLNDSMRQRLAPGHGFAGQPTGTWELDSFSGAGGLRSTAEDMLTYVAANAGITESPLASAMRMTHERRAEMKGWSEIGMAWFVRPNELGGIVEHGGMTGGYHVWIAFSPKHRVGAVVMCNRRYGPMPDLARDLLKLQIQDASPPTAIGRPLSDAAAAR